MNANLITILLCFYISIQSVFAQDLFTLKGVVKDQNNDPLPGVSVIIKNTDTGSITDYNGNFSLKVKEGNILTCSFIGMKTKEITVSSQTSISITLEENIEELDEIVVTGYGEMRKKDLTGAISQISETDEVKEQYQTVDALLQGRAAGVQVISNDGTPGGAVSVKIRGTNSLRGNNEPLYVVDGVIISTAGEGMASPFTGGGQTMAAQNGLTGINARDIESYKVLKDASATAIYGSRGANGVILITTKKGKKGQDRVSVFANTSFNQLAKKVNVLNGYEFAAFSNDLLISKGQRPRYSINPETKEVANINDPSQLYEQKDWQDEIYTGGLSYNAGMNLNGGDNKSRYFISANYSQNQGLQKVAFSNGGNLRFNYTRNVSKKVSYDLNTSLFYHKGSYSESGGKQGGQASMVTQAIFSNPLIGGTTEESNGQGMLRTPMERMNAQDDFSEEFRTSLMFNLRYKITSNLKYQLRIGTDIRDKNREAWYGVGSTQGDRNNGMYNQSSWNRIAYNVDNILTYDKKFGKNHKINLMGTFTFDGIHEMKQIFGVTDFDNQDYRTEFPQMGNNVTVPYAKLPAEQMVVSGLARANYTFKNRYILTASIRADGSSKFRPENQWGYFPSLSTAWYVSDEPFLKNSDIISNLKIRAGWGATGNQSLAPYQTWSNYQNGRYVDHEGNSIVSVRPNNLPNAQLTWETTTQTSVGIDFGFMNDRFTLSTDMYYKETVDLLQRLQIPGSSGFSSYFANQGGLSSKGVELALNAVVLDKGDFKFELGGNIGFNRTIMGDLGVPNSPFYMDGELRDEQYIFGNNIATGYAMNAPANVFMRGRQIGLIYGFKTDGIYNSVEELENAPLDVTSQPSRLGDVKYVDQNGDGVINDADKTIIGNPNPDFTYGANVKFSYKGISLSMLFTGVQGNEILNSGYAFYGYPDPVWTNSNVLRSAYTDNWSEQNPNGQQPRLGYGFAGRYNVYINDRMVEDGSYLRLQTITLGYDIPTERLGMKKIKRINIYATARNLFTITNYSGYDPEITSYLYDGTILGVDWQTLPNPRTFIFGFNMSF